MSSTLFACLSKVILGALIYSAEFNDTDYDPGEVGFITIRLSTDEVIPMAAFSVDLFGANTAFMAPVFNFGDPNAMFDIPEVAATFVSNPVPTAIAVDILLAPGTSVGPGDFIGMFLPFVNVGPAMSYTDALFVASTTSSPAEPPFVSRSYDAVITASRVPEAGTMVMSSIGLMAIAAFSIIRNRAS